MDWKEIEEKYVHFNKDWSHYPKQFCHDQLIPEFSERFEEVQQTKDPDWVESTHPFCKSCFSVYKDVCSRIGVFFNLGENWSKTDLPEKVNRFILNQKSKSIEDQTEEYGKAIDPLIDCLLAQWYQHDNCFLSNDRSTNSNVEVSNPEHILFLLIIAKEIKKIYPLYTSMITLINAQISAHNQLTQSNKPLLSNYIKETKSSAINICRNVLKQYGHFSDKQNIDQIFESSDPRVARYSSRSPPRSKKNRKQSRNKNAYKVTGEMMTDIVQKYDLLAVSKKKKGKKSRG
jgi:hypothetical protein